MTTEIAKPQFMTPEEVIVKLRRLIKKIENICAEIDRSEITQSQMRVIFPIVRDGCGYSMQELSEIACVDKALVSRAISDLEAKGIVERDKEQGSTERNYKIILSQRGEEFFAKQKEKADQLKKRWFSDVTEDEMCDFVRTLNKLIE